MNSKLASASALAVLVSLGSAPVFADKDHMKHGSDRSGMQHQSAGMAETVEGEVRKVDKDTKKITIKHGPMPKFDMPGMTMVFQVKDPALLEKVKAGDKVSFEAEKLGGAFTVTRIEAAK